MINWVYYNAGTIDYSSSNTLYNNYTLTFAKSFSTRYASFYATGSSVAHVYGDDDVYTSYMVIGTRTYSATGSSSTKLYGLSIGK